MGKRLPRVLLHSQLKVDLGDLNRFQTLGELVAALYLQLYYYNTVRTTRTRSSFLQLIINNL